MTTEATFRVRGQGTFTRTFDDLPGGQDVDAQITQLMAAEFGVERWDVVLERVRRLPARPATEALR